MWRENWGLVKTGMSFLYLLFHPGGLQGFVACTVLIDGRDMSTYHPFWVAQQRGYSYGGGSSRRRRRRDSDDEDDGYGSVDDY